MLKTETPRTIHLADYQAHPFSIETVHLTFHLHSTATKVESRLTVKRNPASAKKENNLILDGEELTFVTAKINGELVKEGEYQISSEGLVLNNVPDEFTLEIENTINPESNKALDGLYKSGDIFCTQNEPEGFRRITYYLDRPDVMARFTTKIIAPLEDFPILLSNGNPIGEGQLDGGLHWAEWEDPFPKPSYLYALVAGNLGLVRDSYTTHSGRKIDLRIYCDKGNESRCDHAMESLKKSMKWDEDTFGLEYDLDIYMIVAVDSFNMGAMENKGLNIFNSVYVLANPESATDDNFLGIESVVGHEYFHNWTGNRITCRDWFQLTLKEGLTVYRDQEFSSDLNSRTVQRIQDVQRLRTSQFVEDAGPTSHPIKPNSYIEINNFYTATIYEKGAEIIRMVRTMLGVDGFRKGMDKYFELFDGQAVTTEDFLHAMSVANGDFDFKQFKNWYNQAGTPQIDVKWVHDESKETLTLSVDQSCPPTPGQAHKEAYHFPLAIGLLDHQGNDLPLNLKEAGQTQIDKGLLHIKEKEHVFTFTGVKEKPIVSLNRGFSAPIRVKAPYKLNEFFFMMANDNDLFNRYEAVQRASSEIISHLLRDKSEGKELVLDTGFIESFGLLVKDDSLDPAVKSMLLSIPSVTLLAQEHNPVDYKAIYEVRKFVGKKLASMFRDDLIKVYESNSTPGPYQLDPISVGKRNLRSRVLGMLAHLDDDDEVDAVTKIAQTHFEKAANMTEELSGLSVLSHIGGDSFQKASKDFYAKWQKDTLVIQKWLVVCSSSSNDETFNRVLELENDPVYDKNVPNLVRSLLGGFSRNHVQFHHESGRGYKFMAQKIIEVDGINPQVASRLASSFKDYKRLTKPLKALMGKELEQILELDGLSKNVYEIVSKIVKV